MASHPSAVYATVMSRIIRLTITITITETATIVWSPENEPQRPTAMIVQEQPKIEEGEHETIETTVIATNCTPAKDDRRTRRRRQASRTQPSD